MNIRAKKIMSIDRDQLDAVLEECCLCGEAIRDDEVLEAVRMAQRTPYRGRWRHGRCQPSSNPEDAA
jgi:hypothetical protein